MYEESISEVNTKLKAYQLIHDPTVLLNLIYSKYGDIKEEFELLYINQLVYDKYSRYNVIFKENNLYFYADEYLKRYYRKYESRPRIPKLSDYYRNYTILFCRPRFKDISISEMIQSYEDDRAELFYKMNFESSISRDESEKEKKGKHTDSFSSLDNLTDNKIIFTKKTKKIIDNNLNSNCRTLTLTTTSYNNTEKIDELSKKNNNDGLISSRDGNDSFEKIVHNLICFKKSKKKIEKNKNKNKNKNRDNNADIKKNKISKNKEEKGYAPKKNKKNTKVINVNVINNNINNNNFIKKAAPIINKSKAKSKVSFFSLLKQASTINASKMNRNLIIHNKKKTNLNNCLLSPRIKGDKNIYSKLEEINNNLTSRTQQNTQNSQHQRNKTLNFQQSQNQTHNQTTSINNNNNNNFNSILMNMNNKKTRNYNNLNNLKSLKSLNLKKISQFINFLTVNNNNIKSRHRISNTKNKTFDNSQNITNGNLIKKIPPKIFLKKKVSHHKDKNHKKIMTNRNLLKSKLNLAKIPITMKKKINLNKYVKNNKFRYYNTKFSPSNIFYRNLINKDNFNSHKKIQTTYLSTNAKIFGKNNLISPRNINTKPRQHCTINRSDNISHKIKSKITKGRINNLNINFNNVIFNTSLSNTNEDINLNNNIISNNIINNSSSFNLASTTNNFRNNNTLLNNNLNNSGNMYNNLTERNPKEKKIYIMNLKNVYNTISRNKMTLFGSTFNQADNYSLTSNNTKIYDKNKIKKIVIHNHNHNQSNIFSKEKRNLLNLQKIKLLINKSSNKNGKIKFSKKIIKNTIKKSKINLLNVNKKCFTKSNFGLFTRNVNRRFKNEEKENSNSKNIYTTPNTTGRIYG